MKPEHWQLHLDIVTDPINQEKEISPKVFVITEKIVGFDKQEEIYEMAKIVARQSKYRVTTAILTSKYGIPAIQLSF